MRRRSSATKAEEVALVAEPTSDIHAVNLVRHHLHDVSRRSSPFSGNTHHHQNHLIQKNLSTQRRWREGLLRPRSPEQKKKKARQKVPRTMPHYRGDKVSPFVRNCAHCATSLFLIPQQPLVYCSR